jgi:hypothetical protein
MSFDIVILKPIDASIDDISEVEDVIPLGNVETVSAAFNDAFPTCTGGVFVSGESYSVELSLSGQPVQSAHLSLRFGQTWSDEHRVHFLELLATVCGTLGAIAFAVSDNSRVAP